MKGSGPMKYRCRVCILFMSFFDDAFIFVYSFLVLTFSSCSFSEIAAAAGPGSRGAGSAKSC